MDLRLFVSKYYQDTSLFTFLQKLVVSKLSGLVRDKLSWLVKDMLGLILLNIDTASLIFFLLVLPFTFTSNDSYVIAFYKPTILCLTHSILCRFCRNGRVVLQSLSVLWRQMPVLCFVAPVSHIMFSVWSMTSTSELTSTAWGPGDKRWADWDRRVRSLDTLCHSFKFEICWVKRVTEPSCKNKS